MGLLKNGCESGANLAASVLAISPVEEADASVVRTANDKITVLLREGKRAQGRGRLKTDFWRIRVVQVPDVGGFWHVGGHLLEAELGVGGTDAELACLGVPRNLGNRSLDDVGVLEDHDSLGRDWLRHELRVFTLEVLLKEIDLVVLLDAAGGALHELTGCLSEAHRWLLGQFSHVLVDFVGLLVVVLLGPTTDGVSHSIVLGRHALSVHLQERKAGLMAILGRKRAIFKKCNLHGARTSGGCCQGPPCWGCARYSWSSDSR